MSDDFTAAVIHYALLISLLAYLFIIIYNLFIVHIILLTGCYFKIAQETLIVLLLIY